MKANFLKISPRIFEKILKSLPPEEQEAFRTHRHPCQDIDSAGLIAARSYAEALQAEIKNYQYFKRVEVGVWVGYVLVVFVSTDVCDWWPCPYYKGYPVRRKVEKGGP
jgi:hypothetical protein